jgi:hypothetical protein
MFIPLPANDYVLLPATEDKGLNRFKWYLQERQRIKITIFKRPFIHFHHHHHLVAYIPLELSFELLTTILAITNNNSGYSRFAGSSRPAVITKAAAQKLKKRRWNLFMT